MDALVAAKIFSREELLRINRCRLYLQVYFLSDIVSGNGRLILREAFDGVKLIHRVSRWQWPQQTRPPKSDWSLWKMAIQEVWACSETRLIHQPLGHSLHSSHQAHKFVFSSIHQCIYETFTNGQIQYFHKGVGRTRNSKFYMLHGPISKLPASVIPTTVHKQSQNIVYGETDINHIRAASDTLPNAWDQYIASLDPDTLLILRHATIHNQGKNIARAIRNRTAIAVADASVQKSTRMAAISWLITNRQETSKTLATLDVPDLIKHWTRMLLRPLEY